MQRLVTRPEAEAELAEAAEWYERRRPGLGDLFLEEVRTAAETASEAPARHPAVHGEARRVLLHRFPCALVFRASPAELLVLACVRPRRDPAGRPTPARHLTPSRT